jgi:hypothetical protein
MTPNKRDLKAYSRFDGTGRIVPGSTVLRRNKPKNGNWKETQAYECCISSDCSGVRILLGEGAWGEENCSFIDGPFEYSIKDCNGNLTIEQRIGTSFFPVPDGYIVLFSTGFSYQIQNSIVVAGAAVCP